VVSDTLIVSPMPFDKRVPMLIEDLIDPDKYVPASVRPT